MYLCVFIFEFLINTSKIYISFLYFIFPGKDGVVLVIVFFGKSVFLEILIPMGTKTMVLSY